LAERIDFTFTDGEPGRMSREEMLWHVAIHGAGHRGQVGWIMMENSITPPADRFTTYLHKAEASTRHRPGASSDTVEGDFAEDRPNNLQPAQRAVDETTAQEGKAMSSLNELTERIKRAVGAESNLGKTLKFNLKGEGFIYLDGGSVTNEDKPADLTLALTIDDLKAIGQGKLAPMAAIMSGRLSLSDMGVAANLQGKMQALFSRMQAAL
jgi:putative sterol carrier protein